MDSLGVVIRLDEGCTGTVCVVDSEGPRFKVGDDVVVFLKNDPSRASNLLAWYYIQDSKIIGNDGSAAYQVLKTSAGGKQP